MFDSYFCLNYDLKHIETESLTRKVRMHSGDINHFFIGSRNVYRVNDKRKFMLLLISLDIEFKEITDRVDENKNNYRNIQ
jgi:hypothetical protein